MERTTRYECFGYTRQAAWIDREVFQIRRIDYYDRRGGRIQIQVFDQYQDVGGYWRPRRTRMENHLNGKSTQLRFGEWHFALSQNDGDFRNTA